MAISTQQVGFKNLEYTLTAIPLVPYLKIDGFAENGMEWDRVNPATTRLGADGKAVINSKPVIYGGVLNLLPTSNSREVLDNLINLTTPKFGKSLVDYAIVLTEINHTTGMRTVYSGGVISEADAGNSANLNDGMANKAYRFEFQDRVILPL